MKRLSFTDFKWIPTATYGSLRTYLFYSTTTTEKQFWYEPRFELVDGTEPSLEELLVGRGQGSKVIDYDVTTNGSYAFTLEDYALNTNTINHTVSNIDNTSPVVSDFNKTAIEDTVLTFASTDFTNNYTDAQNTLATIQITALPAA